jgi:TolA-binding protein
MYVNSKYRYFFTESGSNAKPATKTTSTTTPKTPSKPNCPVTRTGQNKVIQLVSIQQPNQQLQQRQNQHQNQNQHQHHQSQNQEEKCFAFDISKKRNKKDAEKYCNGKFWRIFKECTAKRKLERHQFQLHLRL